MSVAAGVGGEFRKLCPSPICCSYLTQQRERERERENTHPHSTPPIGIQVYSTGTCIICIPLRARRVPRMRIINATPYKTVLQQRRQPCEAVEIEVFFSCSRCCAQVRYFVNICCVCLIFSLARVGCQLLVLKAATAQVIPIVFSEKYT